MRKTERKSDQPEVQTIDTSERCAIAVVYTDRPSRERAIGICDSLAGRFEQDLQLEFTWWNTKYLKDPELAQLASDAVANSDLVIFSASASATLAPEVKSWLEQRMPESHGRERAFAAYLNRTPGDAPEGRAPSSPLESYLRNIARHAHMDYLPLAHPTESSDSPPNQPREHRAIISPPSHWGINE